MFNRKGSSNEKVIFDNFGVDVGHAGEGRPGVVRRLEVVPRRARARYDEITRHGIGNDRIIREHVDGYRGASKLGEASVMVERVDAKLTIFQNYFDALHDEPGV